MNPQIVIDQRFRKTKLDGAVKGRVLDFITKVQENPDAIGLDIKIPQGVVDNRVRTGRVTDNWRAVLIALPKSAGFILVTVKPHDDAYTYAAQLRVEVNEVTGALGIYDLGALQDVKDKPVADRPREEATLLGHISLKKLRDFGLTEENAEFALTITDEETLNQLCDALPELQGCALLDLAAGKDPDDVYQDLVGQEPAEPIDVEDLEAALARPVSRLDFAAGSSDELVAAIEGDLAAWRVWLHPLQRKLAYHDGWNGPFRVTGGAGTGKTVTALHRARHLAEREADQPGVRVVVATYTKNLAEALGEQLTALGGPELLRRVDVVNLDALAYRILTQQGRPRPNLVTEDNKVVRQAWQMASEGSQWSEDFLHEEWLDVVLAQGITDRDEYLKAARPGRGVPLNRLRRLEVWDLLTTATRHLEASGVITFTQAAAKAAEIAQTNPDMQYPHGVIDEAQDFHPAHWRLMRALVPPGQDDLFIVGDAHQRIYGRPLTLSHYGIETRGRSRRLTINYRTSEQILRWCVAVMTGTEVDDMEGGEDTLLGARSEFGGPDPELIQVKKHSEEDRALARTIEGWIKEGFAPGEIAVLSPTRAGVESAEGELLNHSIDATIVQRMDKQGNDDQVRVMTMHRAKGLEFRCVAITRLGAKDYPLRGLATADEEEREQRLAQQRALLYVAGSRARERLALLHSGDVTKLMTGSTEV